ncbi:tail fiber assembly protein [Rhodobacter sp. NSM]|uniref:tail fiber assembly protein n=1 Tax=Rhodobacter sp. NSM TaxID=3457501 RepID=UPI003FD00D8F
MTIAIDMTRLVTAEGKAAAARQAAEEAARARRDKLLAGCDWTQVADAPVDREAWAGYRQALRDVPQQAGFPAVIAWPEPPQGN